MEHDLYLQYYPNDFWHKRKKYNFDPYRVFLAIAINSQQLKTDFVVLDLILIYAFYFYFIILVFLDTFDFILANILMIIIIIYIFYLFIILLYF